VNQNWALAAVLCGVGVIGCSGGDPDSNQLPTILVVGPTSGSSARNGEEIKNATQMAFDEIGSQIGGQKVALRFLDEGKDEITLAAAYEASIADPNVICGFFNWHSSKALVMEAVAANRRFPHLFGLGATGDLNVRYASDPATHSVWSKGWPDPPKLSINYVSSIEDAITAGDWVPGAKKVAVYGEDTAWGRSFGNGIAAQLVAKGWTVVATQYVPADGQDFRTAIAAIVAQKPTLVVGTFASAAIETFILQAQPAFATAGLKPLIVADGLGWNSDFYVKLGSASDGIIDQIPAFATAGAKTFSANFTQRVGTTPSPSAAGLAFDYAHFLINVLQKAKAGAGMTRANILALQKDQILTGQFTYTNGILMKEYKYTAASAPDPVVGEQYYVFPVLQYNKGNGLVVWPAALRASPSDHLKPPS
jgi:branched-chain amino acid transport system substrate-binding protein